MVEIRAQSAKLADMKRPALYLADCPRKIAAIAAIFSLSFISLWLPRAHAVEPLQLVTIDLPPFSYLQNGIPRGIAVDVVKEAFDRLDVPISISFVPLTRAQTKMSTGAADAVFPLAYKQDRLGYLEYSHENLVEDSISLFVRRESPIHFDGDLSKLSAYTLGIERGAMYGQVFNTALLNGVLQKPDEASSQAQNLAKLMGRRFDIAVGPRLVILYYAKIGGYSLAVRELKPPVEPGLVAYLAFARQKNHGTLIRRYDKVMAEMRRDGTYDRILRNYIRD